MRSRGTDYPQGRATLEGATKLFKSMYYVNCWNLCDYESKALWRLYGSAGDGVAVCSTYESLVDVMREDENLFLGKIT